MELINDYNDRKGYIDIKRRLDSRQRKIIAWPKKHIPTASIMHLSPKTINRIKRKITNSISIMAAKRRTEAHIDLDRMSSYSSKYKEAMLSLSELLVSKGGKASQATCNKSIALDKYAAFEKQIRENFREDYQQVFPDSTDVLDRVMNLLFETADNSFVERLKVFTHEISILPEGLAKYWNVKLSLFEKIDRLVEEDLETVRKYNAMPKSIFGRTFRNNFKVETKANDFKSKWHLYSQEAAHQKHLETFAAVWKDITHLQSTRQFCRWLANNPNVKPPAFLKNAGLLKQNYNINYSIKTDSMCKIYDSVVTESFIHKTLNISSHHSFNSIASNDISDINIIV